MKLLSLQLRNFKGIGSLDLDTDGANLDVFGANGAGKTTLADALSWLLTGADSLGSKSPEVKTRGADGKAFPGLVSSVSAVLLHGGRELSLEKTYREEWKARRGSLTKELAGHRTDYEIDGAPATKAEFDAVIHELGGAGRIALLLRPAAFLELHWGERRRILLELVAPISDADVIATVPRLAELPARQAGKTLEAAKKIWMIQRRALADQRASIPARIDELSRVARDPPTPPLGELAALREELARIEAHGDAERASRESEISRLTYELTADHAALSALTRVGGACPTCGQALPMSATEASIAAQSPNRAEAVTKLESKIEGKHARLRDLMEREPVPQHSRTGELQAAIMEHEQWAARHHEEERRQLRIEELSAQETALCSELEQIDASLWMAAEFMRAKARLLTDRINAMFALTTWKLFETQVNGTLVECCDATIEGRPYDSALSTSERMRVGLDIINTFAREWGLSAPVLVDNAESITELPPISGQVIRLIVSPQDTVLRIEPTPPSLGETNHV